MAATCKLNEVMINTENFAKARKVRYLLVHLVDANGFDTCTIPYLQAGATVGSFPSSALDAQFTALSVRGPGFREDALEPVVHNVGLKLDSP